MAQHSNSTSDSFSVDGVKSLYREFIDSSDPRTQHWPLVHTPWPGLLLTALYVYAVKVAGPKYMQNRAPFNIRPILLVYNFAMVALSAWMFYEFAATGWFIGYNYLCQPIDFSTSPRAMRMAWASYIYFLSKYIEFADTFNQISFLHVFHHVSMTLTIWLLVHFGAGGHGTFHALVNSAVHFVMYGYYALAALGPGMQKYLWWKRYLTQLQMIQFVLVSLHALQLFWWTNCEYPKWAAVIFSIYPIVFFGLFANFYIQSYRRRKMSGNGAAWARRDPVIGQDNNPKSQPKKKNGYTLPCAAAASAETTTSVLLRKQHAASLQNGGTTTASKAKKEI